MAVQTDRTDADMHKLDQNILLFVRLLRAVGLKVGPSAMLDSLRSVQLVGLHNKAYFYYALSVSLLNRPEDRFLFDQAFHLFWRNPKFMEQMRNMLLPQMKSIGGQAEKNMIRRLEDALGKSDEQDEQASENTELQIDARQTISEKETFQTKDFQMMSSAEWAEAEKAVANLISRLPTRPARRFRPAANGQRSDLRSILRKATQNGGLLLPHYRQPVSQPSPTSVSGLSTIMPAPVSPIIARNKPIPAVMAICSAVGIDRIIQARARLREKMKKATEDTNTAARACCQLRP